MAEQPDRPQDQDSKLTTPQPVGSGDPTGADRQGDIAADDAGATAAVGDQIAVQGDPTP